MESFRDIWDSLGLGEIFGIFLDFLGVSRLFGISGIIFGLLGIYFFMTARKQKKEKRIRMVKVSKKGSFFKGVFLAMLNVLPIPYFAGLNALWRVSDLMEFIIVDIIVFILAAGLGTFAMLYMYVFYFDKSQSKSGQFSKYSDYILSALMLILVIVTLIRIFFNQDNAV